jgi:hypothetical protein
MRVCADLFPPALGSRTGLAACRMATDSKLTINLRMVHICRLKGLDFCFDALIFKWFDEIYKKFSGPETAEKITKID